jgi:hypothetical protein
MKLLHSLWTVGLLAACKLMAIAPHSSPIASPYPPVETSISVSVNDTPEAGNP